MSFSHPLARTWAWLCLFTALSVLLGCGRSTAEVSGTITLNGKAPDIDGLQINFVSEAGGQVVSAAVAKDGTFKAKDVPVGKVLASLIYTGPEDAVPKTKREDILKGNKGKKADGNLVPTDAGKTATTGKSLIPPKFSDPQTSGMTLTVESGSPNTVSWDVK
jgi:hypothetical protein